MAKVNNKTKAKLSGERNTREVSVLEKIRFRTQCKEYYMKNKITKKVKGEMYELSV